jgi:hypothetical protein
VRARVEAEEWHDQSPQGPTSSEETEDEPKSPYSIIVRDPAELFQMLSNNSQASMQTSGLGQTLWWESFQ